MSRLKINSALAAEKKQLHATPSRQRGSEKCCVKKKKGQVGLLLKGPERRRATLKFMNQRGGGHFKREDSRCDRRYYTGPGRFRPKPRNVASKQNIHRSVWIPPYRDRIPGVWSSAASGSDTCRGSPPATPPRWKRWPAPRRKRYSCASCPQPGFISYLGRRLLPVCKVSSTVSQMRLMRLSASGRPHYINGKCSGEDNTHTGGCDERWHPARDWIGS